MTSKKARRCATRPNHVSVLRLSHTHACTCEGAIKCGTLTRQRKMCVRRGVLSSKKRRKSLQSQLRRTSRGKKHDGTPQSSAKRTSNSHRVAFLSLLARDSLFLCLCHCACLSHRGIGVSRSLLPASLCEHQSTGQARTPTDTKDNTQCAVRALLPTVAVQPPHVGHRRETGQSLLARTCSRTWVFRWRRLHVYAQRFLCLRPFTSETSISKLAILFPDTWLLPYASLRVSNAPPSARLCFRRILQCLPPTFFVRSKFLLPANLFSTTASGAMANSAAWRIVSEHCVWLGLPSGQACSSCQSGPSPCQGS